MEVQLKPDIQARLDQLSTETGRRRDDFIGDALTGYFDELSQLRRTLNTRFADLESGRVRLITSEETQMHFQAKSAARRS